MTFRTFHLFYLLVLLLLVAGLLTNDLQIVAAGWHTTITKGMWLFFIPAAACALLAGLIYHYWQNSDRPVRRGTIILHFALVIAGLLLSLNIYRLTLFILHSGAPDTTSICAGSSMLFVFSGPVLLLLSCIVFVSGLMRAKRSGIRG